MSVEENPKCFGYVNCSEDWLKLKGVKKVEDCKTCKRLVSCIMEYNAREYSNYFHDPEYAEDPEGYTPDETPFEVDEEPVEDDDDAM